ncbi:AMP-binding protein, partial [Pseudomonas aeruginosa]
QIGRQAAERPRATAVVYGERALDYGELNLRANRLAHRLIELGVGPDVLVGLALDLAVQAGGRGEVLRMGVPLQ